MSHFVLILIVLRVALHWLWIVFKLFSNDVVWYWSCMVFKWWRLIGVALNLLKSMLHWCSLTLMHWFIISCLIEIAYFSHVIDPYHIPPLMLPWHGTSKIVRTLWSLSLFKENIRSVIVHGLEPPVATYAGSPMWTTMPSHGVILLLLGPALAPIHWPVRLEFYS